ncbi:hypothetical protein ACHAXA_005989 [Cyclostephanos tholiformis]|uniref:Uncharacterized protein n=1 Tax=Cyclostephanos tholiformis TaxID=382380 RepID=A0ABD3SQM5_9STRA
MINPHKLPSERDRRAVVGCLAASLGTSLASLCPLGGSVSRVVVDPSSSFSSSFSSTAPEDDGRMLSRTRSFYVDLLDASVEFLFLDHDVARAYRPYLDAARCLGEGDSDGHRGRNDEDDERGNQHEAMDEIEGDWSRRMRGTKEEETLLRPFLESLSGPEGSFDCIALLVFRLLLSTGAGEGRGNHLSRTTSLMETRGKSGRTMQFEGYDARARYELKKLAVTILSHWEMERNKWIDASSARAHATRKFEALEDALASRLSRLSRISCGEDEGGGGESDDANRDKTTLQSSMSTSSSTTLGLRGIARGLKIGAAGIAAGTVFAVTGGLAAPAILGGIATLVGVSSSAATFVAGVLLIPAATTIFGVGGGTIVARKVGRRTAGLGEFEIEKVAGGIASGEGKDDDHFDGGGPKLSRTMCIAGWIRDEHDFERPFGISPRSLVDRHELLCRYCSVYEPKVLPECGGILSELKGNEDELWKLLNATYGRDPNSLLPLDFGPRYDALLTPRENEAIDVLIRAIGLPLPKRYVGPYSHGGRGEVAFKRPMVNLLSEVLVPTSDDRQKKQMNHTELRSYKAWDFRAEYGGSEVYFVRWEKDLLLELSGSLKEFQMDLAKKAASEALKKTALATLMAAVAIPSTILSLSNIIDEKWTLAAERSDEAGILLAECLLNSNAGHRPVSKFSLIGFSFGARIILSCLKELARNQAMWERQQVSRAMNGIEDGSQAMVVRQSFISMPYGKAQVELSREPASIVEDVILMGMPASVNRTTWISCRGVVGGRLVNCFSQNDMILSLMYRVKNIGSSLLSPPVGISKVDVLNIENYDVSGLVSSHNEYSVAVKDILKLVGYDQPASMRCNGSLS